VFQIEAAIERSTVQTPADWTPVQAFRFTKTDYGKSSGLDFERLGNVPLGRTSGIFYCDQSN